MGGESQLLIQGGGFARPEYLSVCKLIVQLDEWPRGKVAQLSGFEAYGDEGQGGLRQELGGLLAGTDQVGAGQRPPIGL